MGHFGAWWIWILLLVIVGVAAIGFVSMALRPTWLNMETNAIRQSNEFVQTKLNLLTTLEADCRRLKADTETARQQGQQNIVTAREAQMRALDDQIRSERSYLPLDRQPATSSGCRP